jgi:hypothetical protein
MRRKELALTPTDALFGLAFSQAMSSFKSFAGIVFLAKSAYGDVNKSEMGAKSFTTSYGSEYTAPFVLCVEVPPISIV